MSAKILNGKPLVYNVGYQGSNRTGFIQKLKDNGIDLLVDLREKPYSRNRHFCKKELENALAGAGIAYKWAGKCLGGFSCTQKQWRIGCEYLAELAKTRSVVVMCMEWDVQVCHRLKVSEMLEAEFGCSCKSI